MAETEVKVKVKVKVSSKSGKSGNAPKKTRKTRSDKGKKRGRPSNPRVQTGSIDFRTIGTQQTMGPNLTSLIGTLASLARPVIPSQPEQVSTELARYAPRDLPAQSNQNTPPPPQERPDTNQAQEETPITEIKRAMGERIGRLRKEEASLFLKGKGLEAKNILIQKDLLSSEKKLIEEQESMDLKRKSFLVEQIYGTNNNQGFARIQSQLTGLQWTGKEVEQIRQEQGGLDNYRKYLIKTAGLNPAFVDSREISAGSTRKRTDWFYNPNKADLQRAQEERPAQTQIQQQLTRSSSGGSSPRARLSQARMAAAEMPVEPATEEEIFPDED